ncbi:MAG: hypothetical protein HY864_00735 [Chloroflexi bacterium]|nr:hypothetical protein [Chloroflexota bacterium]
MSSLNDIRVYSDGSVEVVNHTPPPFDWNDITAVKRIGRIATLTWDLLTPRWNYASRSADPEWKGLPAPPQTFVFNDLPRDGKGDVLPLTQEMKDCVIRLNGQRTYERIMIPEAGWINSEGVSHYTQRLSWALNHVIAMEKGAVYSRLFAPRFDSPLAVAGTFFEKDHRLHIHKFNAITMTGGLIKLGKGFDCYTPLVDDGQGMWARNDTLEFWPELPFALDDGTQIVEYTLYGYNIYGVRSDGTSVLLRDPHGFKTNWKIENPEVPI